MKTTTWRGRLLRGAITSGFVLATSLSSAQFGSLSRIRFLPDMPRPYAMRDWGATARAMHSEVFDTTRKGDYLPLVWTLPGQPRMFGMPSYVGDESQRGKTGEGICQLGVLLGSTEAGFDMQKGQEDWLALSTQYLNPSEGLVLNDVGGKSGSTFWYEILPSLDYVQLSLRYPGWKEGRVVSKGIADAWIQGIGGMDANFDHTAYSFQTRAPVDNKQWIEPDSAAGIAYLELCEALRSHDPKYFQASSRALQALEDRTTNPTYEVVTPFGALSAAFLNAEKGQDWDIERFANWCLEPTAPQRPGWGMVVGKWGGDDVGGLLGSVTDGGGYAFAMNTFIAAGTLAPVARYEPRFSADIAKWILNLANSARFFYSDSLPGDRQSSAAWKGDPDHGLAYEGLRRTWEGKDLYATGDAVRGKSAATDIGLYGSGYVGILGALVHTTDVPMILRIDLRATDSLPVKAYPTDLYWNPYGTAKTVTVDLGPKPTRVYDAVGHRFLSEKAESGSFKLRLTPKQVVQVVLIPPTGRIEESGRVSRVDGVAIDYDNGKVLRPPHKAVVPPDYSTLVKIGRATLDANGDVNWTGVRSDPIFLAGGDVSPMRASLRFAWDDKFLYFQVNQTAAATELIEAPSLEELMRHWWDFEDLTFDLDPGRGLTSVATVPAITLGWTSTGRRDLAYSPDLNPGDIAIRTSGQGAKANREIDGRVSWDRLNEVYGTTAPGDRWPAAGRKLGCQPLLVDGTFKRQSYIGGARYARPSGLDKNSRTLVLAGD
jgi:hypothetical protein